MSGGDKRTRHLAIPFQSFPFEIEPHDPPGEDTDQIQLLIDPTLTTSNIKTINMSRPEKGDLVEMYLFMQMTAEAAAQLDIRIGILNTNGDHVAISGMDSPYTVAAAGQLTIEADLFRLIPPRGDVNFVSDYFTLLINFISIPDPLNGYSFDKFLVHGSAQIALT